MIVFKKELDDLAFDFVVALAGQCRQKNIEIRLAVGYGEVVIVGDDLPVGACIMRIDKLSGHPDNWQICADRAFWAARKEEVKKVWDAEPTNEDAMALRLSLRGGGALRNADDAPEVSIVFKWNLARARDLLEQEKAFAQEVGQAIRLELSIEMGAHVDLVDLFLSVGLYEFLGALRNYLQNRSQFQYVETVEKLLRELMPVGLDFAWVAQKRKELVGGKRVVSVPRLVREPDSEIYKAGILGGPAKYSEASAGLPTGEDLIPFGEVEGRSTKKSEILKDFKRCVLRKCGIRADDPDWLRLLTEHVKEGWDDREPLFSLTPSVKPDAGDEFPWQFILILSLEDLETATEVSRGIVLRFQKIQKELARLRRI